MAPKVTEEYKEIIDERILDAAKTLFSSKGYHETSMDDIVRESGLSKGAIYGHFESKEKLFLAVHQKQLAESLGRMASGFEPEDTASGKLRKALDAHFGKDCECSREKCMINNEIMFSASRMESAKDDIQKRFESVYAFWQGIVQDGITKAEFRDDLDPRIVASILDSSVDGISLHWMMGEDVDWAKIKDALYKLLTGGLLKKPTKGS
jgi:AcrR family transcriptional regulator